MGITRLKEVSQRRPCGVTPPPILDGLYGDWLDGGQWKLVRFEICNEILVVVTTELRELLKTKKRL